MCVKFMELYASKNIIMDRVGQAAAPSQAVTREEDDWREDDWRERMPRFNVVIYPSTINTTLKQLPPEIINLIQNVHYYLQTSWQTDVCQFNSLGLIYSNITHSSPHNSKVVHTEPLFLTAKNEIDLWIRNKLTELCNTTIFVIISWLTLKLRC